MNSAFSRLAFAAEMFQRTLRVLYHSAAETAAIHASTFELGAHTTNLSQQGNKSALPRLWCFLSNNFDYTSRIVAKYAR